MEVTALLAVSIADESGGEGVRLRRR